MAMDRLSSTPIFSVPDDFSGQIRLVLQQTREPLIVPLLKVLVVVCLVMSTMLFVERVYMGIVIFFIKLLRRRPEKQYKWEAMRDDIEAGSSSYPMVLVQIPMYNEKEVYRKFVCFGSVYSLLVKIQPFLK